MESVIIIFASLIADNFLLSRLFGIESIFVASEKPSQAALYGGLVTGVCVSAGSIIVALYKFVFVRTGMTAVITFASVIIVTLVICVIQLASAKISSKAHKAVESALPMVSSNCVIVGSVLLCIKSELSFGMSVFYLFCAGIVFTFSLFIFSSIQKRLETTTAGECFRGIPILLLSSGLAAMAFSGFYGLNF